MKLTRDTKFGEESTCRFKIDIRNLTTLTRTPESLENFHFNNLLFSKVYIVWAKILQRSYLSWIWRGIQNLVRNRLVSKLSQGIWQILTWALESIKHFHLSNLLSGKAYTFWTKKSAKELPFIKLKRDTKFGEESTCFKIDIRNLTNFDLSTWKSQKCSL